MGKSRLLVVEDDIDIGNMLKIYFSGMDFDVDVAVLQVHAAQPPAGIRRIGRQACPPCSQQCHAYGG